LRPVPISTPLESTPENLTASGYTHRTQLEAPTTLIPMFAKQLGWVP
jgi:hypothetical protein